jgi:DNA-binding response OmpR family regulator
MNGSVRATPTILIAEDEPILLSALARMLRGSGYNVLTAPDGQAALKMFLEAQDSIQLVISDCAMPALLGPELLALIGTLSPSTARLLISATPAFDVDSANEFMLKPFSGKTLVGEVQRLLANYYLKKISHEQEQLKVQRGGRWARSGNRTESPGGVLFDPGIPAHRPCRRSRTTLSSVPNRPRVRLSARLDLGRSPTNDA